MLGAAPSSWIQVFPFTAASMGAAVTCMPSETGVLPAVEWRTGAGELRMAAGREDDKNEPRTNLQIMKISIPSPRLGSLGGVALLTCAWGLCFGNLSANGQEDAQPAAAAGQQTFDSPEDAIAALKAAAADQNKNGLHKLFGPEFKQLLTGDKAQDELHAEKFAAAVAQSCKPVPEGDDKMFLDIGTNDWPMPIPLVKADGRWHFDTTAGKEEIICRHIGQDELHAIAVCRAYVKAQVAYAKENDGPNGSYAMKFKSSPGQKDGLYWAAQGNEASSPFGSVLANSESDGLVNDTSSALKPFHGYYFRILTGQGEAAPGGKKNYMEGGMLAGGFGLLAYPEKWDRSGVMTFIVNQDGNVYEQNLGEKTSRMVRKIKEYNPDGEWKLVVDEGVLSAASEQ